MLDIPPQDRWMLIEWTVLRWPGLLAEYISDGDLVFDIGANIGKMTYAYLGLGARVVAVEPQSVCVKDLESRFGTHDRVTIVRAACGAEVGETTITTYGHGSTISTLVPDYYWGSGGPWARTPHDGKETVEMTTLDALIEEHGRPDFIKIDVEGYELQALRGLSQFAPLSFEFHPHWAQRAAECMERICELDPDVEFNHTKGEQLQYASPVWLDRETLAQDIVSLRDEYGTAYFGNLYARKAQK